MLDTCALTGLKALIFYKMIISQKNVLRTWVYKIGNISTNQKFASLKCAPKLDLDYIIRLKFLRRFINFFLNHLNLKINFRFVSFSNVDLCQFFSNRNLFIFVFVENSFSEL